MIRLVSLPINYSKYFSRLLYKNHILRCSKIQPINTTVERKCMYCVCTISRSASSNVTSKEPRTAGLIVIGDEILKGQIRETNSYFISKILYDLGVKVKRIIVIGDCKDEIMNEVRDASSKFTFVITSGGIGSTHDDVTYEAIARAFNEPLVPNPELVKICSAFFKTSDPSAPVMKLAHIPKSARLFFGYDKVHRRKLLYPNVSVANVFIFPGVPQLLERSFAAVSKDLFGGSPCKFYVKELFLAIEESKITSYLNAAVQEFPSVTFGSYPELSNTFYKVRVTMESQIENEVEVAREKLKSTLPQEWIVQYDSAPLDRAYEKLMNCAQAKHKHLLQSIHLVEKYCQTYKTEEICIFFDGQKESTAVLHLYYACLRKLKIESPITALSVLQKSCKEIEMYIKDATCRYDLQIESLICQGSIAPTVHQYLMKNPKIKILFTGSTKSISKVEPASLGTQCPHVKLLQPFENWTDSEVSDLIVALYLPHCKPKL